MRSVLSYTSARILIFAATAVVLYLLGAKPWLCLLAGALISGVVSYVLLARQRDAMSRSLLSGVKHGKERLTEARNKEDGPG